MKLSSKPGAWFLPIALVTCGLFAILCNGSADALAVHEKKDKTKQGRTMGFLTAKKDNFIEVKADGEVKGRKYVPRWIGGLPADGGGFDKAMLKTFRTLKIGSRVEVNWVFEERLRAVKVKVLQEPKDEPKKE